MRRRSLTVEREEIRPLVETKNRLDEKWILTPEEETFCEMVNEVIAIIEMFTGQRFDMGEAIYLEDAIDDANSVFEKLQTTTG